MKDEFIRRYLAALTPLLLAAIFLARHTRWGGAIILLVAALAVWPLILCWESRGKLRKSSWIGPASLAFTGCLFCLVNFLDHALHRALPFHAVFSDFYGIFFVLNVAFLALILFGPKRLRPIRPESAAAPSPLSLRPPANSASERTNH